MRTYTKSEFLWAPVAQMLRPRNIFLFVGLPLCLLQIWLPTYFVTGDGPCHLYNAHILHSIWTNKDISFYDHFYSLSHNPNPNWLTHVALATMMFAVNGFLAEKILLTSYVLLFLSGFYVLLKRLSTEVSYWMLLIFIFVFHHLLTMGFYNFSMSVAFFFWLIEAWLRYMDNNEKKYILYFFALTLLTFFTHPLAFAFGCFTCCALTFSYGLSQSAPFVTKLRYLLNKYLTLFGCFLPACLLFVKFIMKEGNGNGIELKLYQYRLRSFWESNYLVNYAQRETPIVTMIAMLLSLLFVFALIIKFRKGQRINKYDGLLVSFLFSAFVYKCFPDDLFGGGSLIIRVQFFVYIYMICCISYMMPFKIVKDVAGVFLGVCFLRLTIIKLSCLLPASDGVSDYTSAEKYIKPYSVIFTLDFAPNGKNENNDRITDRIYLFSHAGEYMGVKKPLIFLDNYEANTNYFPLSWKDELNPYYRLGKYEGIEGWPPYAEIKEYKQKCGVTIDYVLMWCFDPSYLQNEHFKQLYDEINSMYHKVYTSHSGRTILLEKK